MIKTMKIETERLILRKFIPNDWKDLYEYLSQEPVVKAMLQKAAIRF